MKMCEDCKTSIGSVHYMFCVRCKPCSDAFQEKIRAERQAKRDAAICEDCGIKTGGPDVCEECCEHDDVDEGYCLICDKDLTEALSAAAYDRAKDFRKYGEW